MARLSIEARRKNFIDAAITVIANEGVAQATTRRIADAANAPLAGLHYCFETKEDLFQAVFEGNSIIALERGRGSVTPGMGLHKAVGSIFRAMEDWSSANPALMQAQFELFHWALRSPDYRHLARNVYLTFYDATVELLNQARQEHEMDADVKFLAQNMLASHDGRAMQKMALQDDLSGSLELAIIAFQQAIAKSDDKQSNDLSAHSC